MSSHVLAELSAPVSTRPVPPFIRYKDVIGLSLLRNHFNISTWLALGAILQLALSLLPIRKLFAILPAVVFVTWRLTEFAMIAFGMTKNPYMEGVIPGKVAGQLPGAKPGEGTVAVLLLGARSNHYSGFLAQAFRQLNDYFVTMQADLEANASTNGFLGATTYLNANDRTTSSSIMTTFYFRSKEDISTFAHGPVHREGWDWWLALVKSKGDEHVAISHEIYEAPAGRWESVWVNADPNGFGAIMCPLTQKDGSQVWARPIVQAEKGEMRTHAGRLGRGMWERSSENS